MSESSDQSKDAHQALPDEPSEYVVVARRYRPQSLDELIGQQHIAKALAGAIESNRVGHAYLFTGARGVGKTSAARILAKALDCVDGPAAESCNRCEICQSISAGEDVDVLEIDGASNRGIDEIRTLRSNVNIRPTRARFKIYIIDEVHMLTREAFNALLKTLEEPPEHVKFIFCTTEPNKIPVTVLSRCQRFDFAGIQTPSIAQRLAQIVEAEGVTADAEALNLLARRAAGSMRDSQSLLEQLLAFGGEQISVDDVHAMLGTAGSARLLEMARHIAAANAAGALAVLDQALAEGVDVGQLLEQLVGVFRDCMVAQAGCESDSLLSAHSADEQQQVQILAGQLGLPTTLALLQVLQQATADLRYTTHRRTVAELALVRACQLEGLEELSALVSQLRSGTVPDAPAKAAGKSTSKKKSEPLVTREREAHEAERAAGPPALSAPKLAAAAIEAIEAVETVTDSQDAITLAQATPASQPALPSAESSSSPVEVVSSSPKPLLSEETAKQIWEDALAKLTGMVTAKAREYSRLSAPEPNRLVVTFSQTYNLCRSYCEQPEQLARIETALQEVTGTRVRVDFDESQEELASSATERQSRPQSRQKRLAEAAENPLVRRAGELFGARPVDVDSQS